MALQINTQARTITVDQEDKANIIHIFDVAYFRPEELLAEGMYPMDINALKIARSRVTPAERHDREGSPLVIRGEAVTALYSMHRAVKGKRVQNFGYVANMFKS